MVIADAIYFSWIPVVKWKVTGMPNSVNQASEVRETECITLLIN